MSVMVTHFSLAPSVVEGPEVISPIEMPATGDDILTPASIRASVDAQVEAIEVEPFEPRTSETSLIVYGNASFKGRTGIRAFSAKAKVDELTFEPKEGDVFNGKVVRIMPFGAFVELPGGKDGLVHISHLAPQRVGKVEDVVKLGDVVTVKVIEIDDMGRINLTMKGVSEEDKKRVL